MKQMHSCPRCGAAVEHSQQFCGHCGNPLQSGRPSPSPQHGQYPNQQPPRVQPVYQQPGQQQIRADNQSTKPQNKRSSRAFLLLVILIAIIFIASGIALVAGGSFSSTSSKLTNTTPAPTAPTKTAETPPSNTPASPQSPPPKAPVLPTSQATPITATELLKAYTDDSIGSSAKYDGNIYVISGIVSSVVGISPAYLYFNDKAVGPFEIQCTFSQDQDLDIALINPGQSVKVEGRVFKFGSGIIVVNNCRLVQ